MRDVARLTVVMGILKGKRAEKLYEKERRECESADSIVVVNVWCIV